MSPAVPRFSTTLQALAERHRLELRGDPAQLIEGLCALAPGQPGRLSFCGDPKLHRQLAGTQASAVVITPRDAPAYKGNVLIAANPSLAFAAIARDFDIAEAFTPGIDAAAKVEATAVIGEGCGIAAGVVIEAGVSIGAGCYIGPGCVIRQGASIGPASRLEARVYVGPDCVLGARARALPGAVIGSRGFGLVPTASGWVEVPQLGRVLIGDDVEIGANTTIDRGALDDTVIGNGVKLDNQIQIAHNCRIGAHTAIAACVGIAGSTEIGRNCMIAGAVGINGHLKICDNVVVLGMAMVTRSITEPGTYGGYPAQKATEWRKLVVRQRRLAEVELRLHNIEKTLRLTPPSGAGAGEQDDL